MGRDINKVLAIADLKIGSKAKKYVNQALDSNRLSYGPFTKKYEDLFAKIVNRKFAVISNSGTSGLQVALDAMKKLYVWKDGDEVLVPAITFIASSNVIIQNNLTPVFVDVESDFYCMDPDKIEEKITKKTKAIMVVHLFGQSAHMDKILKIAKKHKLKIIEDSCETLLVDYKNKPVGSLGDVSVFSSYIAHIITTGVGGMVTTNNKKLATIMKSLMFHGRDNIYLNIDDDDTKDEKKIRDFIERRFQFLHVGYSYRLTEMEAALGLAELEDAENIKLQEQKSGVLLNKHLSEFAEYLQLPETRKNAEHIYMLYPVVIKNKNIDRDDLLLYLEANGIETRLFFPLLSQPIYKKLFGDIEKNYPVAKHLVERGFIIGSHRYVTEEMAIKVNKIFKNYFNNINVYTKSVNKWEKSLNGHSKKEVAKILAEKDAEIERLKDGLESSQLSK